MRIAVDLDGVVWRGDRTIPGAPAGIHRLRAAGHDLVFVTNHALSPAAKAAELSRHGIDDVEVVTAAEAAAYACTPGSPVAVLGDPSLVEVLADAGLSAWDLRHGPAPGSVAAVVVGAHADWDRDRIGRAADLVRAGARFIATNDDPTYPVSEGPTARLLPGNGALVAALAVAAGVPPEVAGKPFAPMADLLRSRHGPVDLVIGDQPHTDGRLAAALAARFALVLSGVTAATDLPTDPVADLVAEDIGTLAAVLAP